MIDAVEQWLIRQSRTTIILLTGVSLALICIVDYLTDVSVIVGVLYLAPISAITWHDGRKAGIVTASLATALWAIVDYYSRVPYSTGTALWNVAVMFFMFVAFCAALAHIRQDGLEQQRLLADLEKAMAEIKTLSGVLPICAWCKKIRDENGEWHTVEVYLQTHTEVDLTHSICPDCRKEKFPRI